MINDPTYEEQGTSRAGEALATGAAYYFTHPQRVVAEVPADLEPRSEEVTVTTRDGVRLRGVWLPAPGGRSSRTIVHHHGYNASGGVLLSREPLLRLGVARKREDEEAAPLLAWPLVREGLARGYNFLLVDARAHGRSGGAWDPTGGREISDMLLWGRWLRVVQEQCWAGLWGHSFGASVGLALSLRAAGGGFDAMALESPVITPRGLYAAYLPRAVYQVVQPALLTFENPAFLAWLRQGRASVPVFLMHGAADRHVPIWQGRFAFEYLSARAAGDEVAFWAIPGADHLEGLQVAPEEYIHKTLAWFDRWM
jgi:pimeloyl-ACP methyl ester carboxylesterase